MEEKILLKDLECLCTDAKKEDRWLNDEVLRVFGNLLNKEHSQIAFSFPPIISVSGRSLNWKKVSFRVFLCYFFYKKIFQADLSKTKKFLFPRHEMNHWFLVLVDLEAKHIFVLDSFFSSLPREDHIRYNIFKKPRKLVNLIYCLSSDISHFIEKELNYDISCFPVQQLKVRQQENIYDCGLYVLKFMECISRYSFLIIFESNYFKKG